MAKLKSRVNPRQRGKGRARKPIGRGAKVFLAVLGLFFITIVLYLGVYQIQIQMALSKTKFVQPDWETDGTGTPSGTFKEPWGAATDLQGNFYVTEFSAHRVRKFDPSGKEILSFGEPGKGEGQFNQPSGIYVDKDGFIYVCDSFNYRIQKFDSDGRFIKEWSRNFNGPKGIGGYGDRIYVVDTGNHKLQVFDKDGNFQMEWGSFGTDNGKFREPEGCVIDPEGNIYVADSDNLRIQKFDFKGKFLASFKVSSWKGKNDEMPYLAIDQGSLYATNASQKSVLKFSLAGVLQSIYRRPGKDAGFPGAAGMALDGQGHVLVVERAIGKVARFTLPEASNSHP